MTSGETVTVAVATYRRVDELRALLSLLVEQAREAVTVGWDAEVLVVDNDPAESARPVLDEFLRASAGTGLTVGIRYVAEAEPGIASARNRALDEAGGSRLLVFIDDDERPHSGWLLRLLDARASTGAAAVAGAVVSEFDGPLDPWVRAGDFFRRRRPPTGTVITVAATNNLLLDLAVVRRLGLRFDKAFGLTGGSDTLFTRQLTAAGGLMVWCDEAVVTDLVPAARMTPEWVLRRAFRSGNSASRVEMTLAASWWGRMLVRWNAARRGLPRSLGGAAQWAVGRICGRARLQAKGLRTAARGCGMLAGAFGVAYAEYRRVESVAVP
jgi:succinoglycan biosynthesis protein ExoM